MGKIHIYIIQFFCILGLLCGYLLSDQPDSQSVMHFNLDSSSHYVMSKAHKHLPQGEDPSETSITSQDRTSKKFNIGKHISFKVILPQRFNMTPVTPAENLVHATPISDPYRYLFFREINPPPPKAC